MQTETGPISVIDRFVCSLTPAQRRRRLAVIRLHRSYETTRQLRAAGEYSGGDEEVIKTAPLGNLRGQPFRRTHSYFEPYAKRRERVQT
jgi:hypothetical protein